MKSWMLNILDRTDLTLTLLLFLTHILHFYAMYILTPDENQQQIFTVKGENKVVREMDKEENREEMWEASGKALVS